MNSEAFKSKEWFCHGLPLNAVTEIGPAAMSVTTDGIA